MDHSIGFGPLFLIVIRTVRHDIFADGVVQYHQSNNAMRHFVALFVELSQPSLSEIIDLPRRPLRAGHPEFTSTSGAERSLNGTSCKSGGSSRCAKSLRRVRKSRTVWIPSSRQPSHRLLGNRSSCKDAETNDRSSAALMPISAVSKSRSSPTRMMVGSCRRSARQQERTSPGGPNRNRFG